MSEPEIARRCSACGASVRQQAMFCPQCGNQIVEAAPTTAVATTDTVVDTPPPATRIEQDGMRGRVEKIRKVSSVVIDQAAYDPSLRFLLVAAAMFLLFLVLLLASKVIG